ncbi:hypothetical protein C9427_11165 [Mesorhizobium helmanticense]|uniref:Uncharacterized protein n=1 Tax=Mesorhizobium helmanticense TaxID=1776423 RepID=A0A2T4IY76_9HYPH|nr:hypothetical protein C9427_11165 [Mesorhizobium helmanticense]
MPDIIAIDCPAHRCRRRPTLMLQVLCCKCEAKHRQNHSRRPVFPFGAAMAQIGWGEYPRPARVAT